MDGSLYPNGVLVDQAALRRTETTKAAQIELNRVDLSSRGVVSGGVLKANGTTAGNYDVAVFAGYTPRGDYIESTVADINQSLSSVVLGDINYICAIYTEVNTKSQPHETDGTTYPTYSRGSYTLKALSQTQYTALQSLTSDDNLANDAIDRCLLLGTITGAGASTPPTVFVHPTTYDNVLYSAPSTLSTIPGVTITGIDPDTTAGTGTVSFTYVSPTFSLAWVSAATAATAGATIDITAGGTFTTNADSSGSTITVEVVPSLLPTTAALSESVVVHNLYSQDVPRLTAKDVLHRTRVGTGYVTATNPHGNRLDDFGGQSLSLLDEHQDVMHSNGLWSGSASTLFNSTVNFAGADNQLDITLSGSTDIYYVNGKKLDGLVSSSSILFDPATIASLGGLSTRCNYFEVYVDDSAALVAKLRAQYPASRTCTGTSIIDMSEDHEAAVSLNLDVVKDATNFTFTWDGGSSMIITVASLSTAGTYRIIRLYRSGGVQWIDLCITNDNGSHDANLPQLAGTYQDAIQVLATPDLDQHMRIYSFPYKESATAVGLIGYPLFGSVVGTLVDHRVRGTLGTSDVGDAALEDLVHRPTQDHNESGIIDRSSLDGSFKLLSYSGTTATNDYYISGGEFYCRGKKTVFEGVAHSAMATIPDATYIYWVHVDGTLRRHDITAIGSGSLADSLYYILGSSFIRETYDFDSLDVAAASQSPYRNDRPQQGVPLFMVTAAASLVSDICYISRAVGPHVRPWTVADRSTTCTAEYGSLYVAFAYAKYLRDLGADGASNCIDVTVIGDNEVSRSITQPVNVNVRGVSDSVKAITTISYASSTGAWILTAGNKVEGLQIEHTAATAHSVAINITDACEVSRCNVSSSTVSHFLEGTSAIGAIVIRNRLRTIGGLFSEATGAITIANVGWIVSDNYIIQTSWDAAAFFTYTNGMINLGGVGATISGNYILTLNPGGNYTPAINGYLTKSSILDNNIFVTAGNQGCFEAGIFLVNATDCVISSNKVSSLGSDVGIGIVVGPTRNTVTGNNLSVLGMGILALVDAAYVDGIQDLTITNNTVHSCVHRGITVSPLGLPLANVTISGNSIKGFAKDNTSIEFPGTGLAYSSLGMAGIEIYQLAGAVFGYDANRKNINITNNNIRDMALATTNGINMGILYSIDVKGSANATYENLNISNNSISDIASITGTIPSATGIGFYFDGAGGTPSLYRNISINSNNISLKSGVAAQLTKGVASISDWTAAMAISSNVITCGYPESGHPEYWGTGIYLDLDNSTSCNVTGNSILALWEGITLKNGEFSVIGNNITSYSQGIFSVDSNATISNNAIKVYTTSNEAASPAAYGSYGAHGIILWTASDLSRYVITNNSVELAPLTGSAMLGSSSCLYIALAPGTFDITNNDFRMEVPVDTVIGTSSIYPSLTYMSMRTSDAYASNIDYLNNKLTVRYATSTKVNGLVIVGNGIDETATYDSYYHSILVKGNTIRTPNVETATLPFNDLGNLILEPLFISDTLGAFRALVDTRGTSYADNTLYSSAYPSNPLMNPKVSITIRTAGVQAKAVRSVGSDAGNPTNTRCCRASDDVTLTIAW